MTHSITRLVAGISWSRLAIVALSLAALNLVLYALGVDPAVFAYANTLVTPSWVMKEGMFRLTNSLKFSGEVSRNYDKQYKVDGAKVGYIVNARLPVRYLVRDGAEFQGQDVTEQVVPIAITDQIHVAIEFTAASLTMEVDNYRERYLEPAFDKLANEVDYRGMTRMAKATSAFTGTPGVTPGSSGTLPQAAMEPYLEAGEVMDDGAVPVENRVACLNPRMHRFLVQGLASLFAPANAIGQNFRKGMFGHDQLGIERWYKAQNTYRHTIGALGGTPLTNGAAQSGSSIVTDGWTASAATRLKEGDKITFADVYAVNPQSLQSTGRLKQFTITEDCASDGSGNLTAKISPAIVGPGSPYQNVNALPADGAAIKTFGHASSYASVVTPLAPIFHPDAYALVTADLQRMEGAWVCERVRSKALGVAFRLWKDRDIRTDSAPCRVDILFGWKAVREELACVVCG
jgi:hypothetical protein